MTALAEPQLDLQPYTDDEAYALLDLRREFGRAHNALMLYAVRDVLSSRSGRPLTSAEIGEMYDYSAEHVRRLASSDEGREFMERIRPFAFKLALPAATARDFAFNLNLINGAERSA